MQAVTYAHISFLPDGMPVITGTRFKIVQIIRNHVGKGWEAGQIQAEHPQLSLAQIHSALAYYYDHKIELDHLIQRRQQQADRIIADRPSSPTRERLSRVKH